VQHDAVDGVVPVRQVLRLLHGQAHDAAHLLLRLQHLRRALRLPGRRLGTTGRLPAVQHTAPAHSRRPCGCPRSPPRGHAQFALQQRAVDGDALAAHGIAHVHRHHHGQAHGARLQHHAQAQLQLGGIDHADQQVGRGLARALAGDHVARHGLIGTQGVEAVGTRQVQHAHGLARGRGEHALLALDRDPGVIGHLLAAAGQQVEQGGLAAVGMAQQGQAHGSGAHWLASVLGLTVRARWGTARCALMPQRPAPVAWC
jgi:hypothetical protein